MVYVVPPAAKQKVTRYYTSEQTLRELAGSLLVIGRPGEGKISLHYTSQTHLTFYRSERVTLTVTLYGEWGSVEAGFTTGTGRTASVIVDEGFTEVVNSLLGRLPEEEARAERERIWESLDVDSGE
jgi:hypothetical protein